MTEQPVQIAIETDELIAAFAAGTLSLLSFAAEIEQMSRDELLRQIFRKAFGEAAREFWRLTLRRQALAKARGRNWRSVR